MYIYILDDEGYVIEEGEYEEAPIGVHYTDLPQPMMPPELADTMEYKFVDTRWQLVPKRPWVEAESESEEVEAEDVN